VISFEVNDKFFFKRKKNDPLTTFPPVFPKISIHQESVPWFRQFAFLEREKQVTDSNK
jgi:hypothetical protein